MLFDHPYSRQELIIPEKNRKIFNTEQDLKPEFFLEIGDNWYKVVNDESARTLIKLFSNDLVQEILVTLMREPLTIPQMLRICGSTQTSTYRKINLLIKYGILRKKEYGFLKNGKIIHSYYSILRGMRIELGEKISLSVKIHFSGK